MTAALVMSALVAGVAIAAPGTFKSGPWASTGPDSGTCGNDWATDTYNRNFMVQPQNADQTYNVVEKYAQGDFVTVAGKSPGACETGTDNGRTISAGVSGTFSGTLDIVVTNGTLNKNATCVDPCTTATWVTAFFGGSATATYTTPHFSFQYKADRHQDLTSSQWINADTGNSGDIASN
jgi:hypothetical protein